MPDLFRMDHTKKRRILQYYDIVFTCSWVNDFDKNAEAGLYYDITDLVQKETPALYESIGKYWDCATVNGRIIVIPYDQETEIPQAMALWDCDKVIRRLFHGAAYRNQRSGCGDPQDARADGSCRF